MEKVKALESKVNELTLNASKVQENTESEYTEIESHKETETREEPKIAKTG